MKVRHIRKRAHCRIKRRNAFWWGVRAAARRAIESTRLPDWAKISDGVAAFAEALAANVQALPPPESHDPQPLTPKVRR